MKIITRSAPSQYELFQLKIKRRQNNMRMALYTFAFFITILTGILIILYE